MAAAAGLAQEESEPSTAAQAALVISAGSRASLRCHDLNIASWVLPDPQMVYTIRDVTAPEVALLFVPNQASTRPVDIGEGALWVRVRLQSQLAEDHEWWLALPGWGVIELYAPGASGLVRSRSGAFVPLRERPSDAVHPNSFVLPVRVSAGLRHVTLYLRLSQQVGREKLPLNPTLHTDLHPTFARADRGYLFFLTLVAGAALVLGLYHLVLFIRVPHRVYLYFGLAMIGRGLLALSNNGYLLEFVWPDSPRYGLIFAAVQQACWQVPFLLFTMAFLDTKVQMPRSHKLLITLTAVALLDPLGYWLQPGWFGEAHQVMMLTWSVTPVFVAAAALRTKRAEATLFLAANVLMLTYVVAQVLRAYRIDMYVILPSWGWYVGLLLATILFSIAVAAHIRGLQQQKELAQQQEAKAQIELGARKLETAVLSSELAKAQLEALKNQLRPHFLFNALNSISALMHESIPAAERAVQLLGDLLRASLERDGTTEISLDDEAGLAKRYLEIEAIRYQDRLAVVWKVDEQTRDALVPPLVLQPLVENAVRHGIAPRSQPTTLWIRTARVGDAVQLSVRDSGAGQSGGVFSHGGVGLTNTRARLQNLYGDRAHLQAGAAAGGGWEVVITLPYRTRPAS